MKRHSREPGSHVTNVQQTSPTESKTPGLGFADDIDSDDGLDYRNVTQEGVDSSVAKSLSLSLQVLADYFWAESPVEINTVRLHKCKLVVSIDLPFISPIASEEPGEWIQSEEDIKRIRTGFANFLKRQPATARRISNAFYSEFHRFLMVHTKIFHFSENIRNQIEQSGERRLAGRPKNAIPISRKAEVKKQLATIHKAVVAMQREVLKWKQTNPDIGEREILERLKEIYDTDKHPWSRFVFQSLGNSRLLPATRAYKTYKHRTGDELTRPTIAEPARWSTRDVAAQWARIWFLREHGEKYDLKEISTLLKSS